MKYLDLQEQVFILQIFSLHMFHVCILHVYSKFTFITCIPHMYSQCTCNRNLCKIWNKLNRYRRQNYNNQRILLSIDRRGVQIFWRFEMERCENKGDLSMLNQLFDRKGNKMTGPKEGMCSTKKLNMHDHQCPTRSLHQWIKQFRWQVMERHGVWRTFFYISSMTTQVKMMYSSCIFYKCILNKISLNMIFMYIHSVYS